ncbi:hypothetical protein ATO67_18025 [Agrobacterium bohemicum]|uniref:Uncharacterized protein n=1 Tax=Agrobacterium bohemicum TaxID=2052828 RepID=A0A135P802_9HYPH|nr:hypothetical protein ATO67_18025 [Agrobacterium bohemicum]
MAEGDAGSEDVATVRVGAGRGLDADRAMAGEDGVRTDAARGAAPAAGVSRAVDAARDESAAAYGSAR